MADRMLHLLQGAVTTIWSGASALTYMISQQPSLTPETNDSLLSDAASSAAIALSPLAVILAAALLVVNAAISAKFALGWHKSLAVACIR